MGEDKKTLGSRALAAGMRWDPGMRDVVDGDICTGSRFTEVEAVGLTSEWRWAEGGWAPLNEGHAWVPDLADPATQGCILAQASERWAKLSPVGAAIDIRRCVGGWRWRAAVAWCYPTQADERELQTVKLGPIVPTYAEACVSALEGSPA